MWIQRYKSPIDSSEYPSTEELINNLISKDEVFREIREKLDGRENLDVKWFLETEFFMLREGDADHGRAVITNPLGAILVMEEYDLLDKNQLGELEDGIKSGAYHPPGERYVKDTSYERSVMMQGMLDIDFFKTKDWPGPEPPPYPYMLSYNNGGWIFLSDYLLSGREMPNRWLGFLYRLFEDMYTQHTASIEEDRVVTEKHWREGTLGLIYPIVGDRATEEVFYKKRTIKTLIRLLEKKPEEEDGEELSIPPILRSIEWTTVGSDFVTLYPMLMGLGQRSPIDCVVLELGLGIISPSTSCASPGGDKVCAEPIFSRKNWQNTVKLLDRYEAAYGKLNYLLWYLDYRMLINCSGRYVSVQEIRDYTLHWMDTVDEEYLDGLRELWLKTHIINTFSRERRGELMNYNSYFSIFGKNKPLTLDHEWYEFFDTYRNGKPYQFYNIITCIFGIVGDFRFDPEHTCGGDRQRFAVKLIKTEREEFVREVVKRGAVQPEDIRRAYLKLLHEGEEIKILPYLIYVAQVK